MSQEINFITNASETNDIFAMTVTVKWYAEIKDFSKFIIVKNIHTVVHVHK